jgi:hypothetical protein
MLRWLKKASKVFVGSASFMAGTIRSQIAVTPIGACLWFVVSMAGLVLMCQGALDFSHDLVVS